jgi:hypothetical protein
MSQLFQGGSTNVFACPGVSGINDDQIAPPDFRYFVDYAPAWGSPGDCQGPDMSWPRSHLFGNGPAALGNPFTGARDGMSYLWELDCYWTGGHRRSVVSGQTLDSGGAAVAGATVYLMNAATGQVVDTAVSDAGGNYKMGDPNSTTNFVVAQLPSTPIMGATVNTLTGT